MPYYPPDEGDTAPGGGGGGSGSGGGGPGSGGGGGGINELPDTPPGGGPLPEVVYDPGEEGDLGSLISNETGRRLLNLALRSEASANFPFLHNHRYRGHREAYKFNYQMQGLLASVAYMFLILKPKNDRLTNSETAAYPSSTDMALFYHTEAQIRFKEFMLLRDTNTRWFL